MQLVDFVNLVLICWTAWSLGIRLVFTEFHEDLIGSTKVNLCKILLKNSLRGKLKDDHHRLTRSSVLFVPQLAVGSKCTSLSARFCFVSPGCRIWLVFCCVFFFLNFSLLILLLPHLGLPCKSTSLSPPFCVCRLRQYDTICWEFDLFQNFLSLVGWLIGQRDQWVWPVFWKRQGMLTHRPPTDPKCKCNISSFFTLPHSSDSFVCAKEIMIIALWPQMMEWWESWSVVHSCDRAWVPYFYIFCDAFLMLLIILSWTVHDSCCVFLYFF